MSGIQSSTSRRHVIQGITVWPAPICHHDATYESDHVKLTLFILSLSSLPSLPALIKSKHVSIFTAGSRRSALDMENRNLSMHVPTLCIDVDEALADVFVGVNGKIKMSPLNLSTKTRMAWGWSYSHVAMSSASC
jgi:hypothetical protein